MTNSNEMRLHPLAEQVQQAITMGLVETTSTAGTFVEPKERDGDGDGKRVSAVDLLTRQPWAIQSDMLETIVSIARRENESPEAVAARLGRPLQNARTVTVRDGVAVVPVTGPIFRYANLFTEMSGATSLEVLAQDFNRAVEDPAIRAIVLDVNSPGGQADGISEFAEMVAGADKPVTAYVGGMGASAAYWIAGAASELVISKTGEVGSIGAVFGVYKAKPDSDAVEFVSTQSPMKRPDPESDEGRAELQARIDALAQVFIQDVAKYRGVPEETVLSDFGKGGLRLGEEAVRLGMADRVSTLESVIAGLSGGATEGGIQAMDPKTGQPAADKPAILGAVTASELKEHNPNLAEELRAEALEEGKQAGAEAECKRVQDVFAQAMPGHDDLIKTLAFDGKTTGPEAAMQVLAAEREAKGRTVDKLKADAPEPIDEPSEPDTPVASGKDPQSEDEAKAAWDASAELRNEFPSAAAYWAFCQVDAKNKARK